MELRQVEQARRARSCDYHLPLEVVVLAAQALCNSLQSTSSRPMIPSSIPYRNQQID